MKVYKSKIILLSLIVIFFSSCQKMQFTDIDSSSDALQTIIEPEPPKPISTCANKDMDSLIVSEEMVKVSEKSNVHLHFYSCDAENFKEVIWLSTGSIENTNSVQDIIISFESEGEQEIQAIIIYKDTVLGRNGNYVEGTRPKIVKKSITSI